MKTPLELFFCTVLGMASKAFKIDHFFFIELLNYPLERVKLIIVNRHCMDSSLFQ
jgi:hypothetical protein